MDFNVFYLIAPRSPPRTPFDRFSIVLRTQNEHFFLCNPFFTALASLCDHFEHPRGPIPPKVSSPEQAWEAVSLQKGVDFHIFAWTKNRSGLHALILKILGPEAPPAAPP